MPRSGMTVRQTYIGPQAMAAYCHVMLGNTTMIEELQSKSIDLAVVDLFFNECGLALANHLGEY